MKLSEHCYVCGCETGRIEDGKIKILSTYELYAYDDNKKKNVHHVLCNTCAKKVKEYMELLKNTPEWTDKPKPCVLCGSERVECASEAILDDGGELGEEYRMYCNECGTSFSNDKHDWTQKATVNWWNGLNRG